MPVTAKLGLVIFLAGVAAGRIVIGAFARPHRLYRMLVILFARFDGMFAAALPGRPGPADAAGGLSGRPDTVRGAPVSAHLRGPWPTLR